MRLKRPDIFREGISSRLPSLVTHTTQPDKAEQAHEPLPRDKSALRPRHWPVIAVRGAPLSRLRQLLYRSRPPAGQHLRENGLSRLTVVRPGGPHLERRDR